MIEAIANLGTLTPQQQVRQASEQLVSSTFIRPLLEHLRQEPLRSDMFHGGLAEDMFMSQLDTILADRITQKTKLPLVDAVYRKIMKLADQRSAAPDGKLPGAGIDRHG